MTKLRQIVQLILTTQLTSSEIARSIGASRTTVTRYRLLAIEKKYIWEELRQLPDDELDSKFNKIRRRMTRRRMPDFALIHNELQNPTVTLLLLWEEYCLADPSNALSYSQFTEHYRSYRKKIDRVMRQKHVPGEKVFVDFSGRRPGYTDAKTGEWIAVELFVGVLGVSNLTYALCVHQQTLPFWIACHIKMFAFFGGVPRLLVPDNLKSAISRPGRDFITNPTYREMAEHYGTAVFPTRTYKPRDKAKVEGGVLIVQRWILARLRHQNFFSIEELNSAVAALVKELNHRSFKRLPGCRATRYEEMERSTMLPLPTHPYELGEWTGLIRVDNGYHIRVRGHWYSVPHRLVGEQVMARSTANTVEIFHNRIRVASHLHSDVVGGLTTNSDHQPEAHRAYAARTPDNFIAWATQIGPSTEAVVRAQFDRVVPALGLPACDGLRKLVHTYGAEEVEAAAARAIEICSLTVKSVRSLLSTRRHRLRFNDELQGDLPLHNNLRGPKYYAETSEDSTC